MKIEMIAIAYGTKIAAYNKTTKRVVLASVVDTTAAFRDWEIKAIEQDKIAPDSLIASLEAAGAKSGSKTINL